MIRAAALLLLLAAACDGTQSQRAFTPRPPAAVVVWVATPNTSSDRAHDLADALEQSLEAQEDGDRVAQAPSPMPDQVLGAPDDTQPRRHRRGADHPSVASLQKPNTTP
jgi:hypothetical protein